MAREEFGVNNFKDSDIPEYRRIVAEVINRGGTRKDWLAALSHLISLKLKFKSGYNIKLHGGYKFQDINTGISWQYISFNYENITSVDDNSESIYGFWDPANMSGKTTISTYLAFIDYDLKILQFYRFMPVVGFGLGIAHVNDELTANSVTAKRDQNVFAYQFKAGLNFSITKNLSTSLTGVFLGTSEIKATNNKLKQGQLNLGVKWIFN